MSAILEPQPVFPPLATLIEEAEIQRAKAYGRAAKSASTRREYARDWSDFERYCRSRTLTVLPAEPQTVARYASTLAETLKIASIRRRMVVISRVHQEHGLETPTSHTIVREVLTGIGNTHGSAERQKGRSRSISFVPPSLPCSAMAMCSKRAATAPCSCWALPGRFAGPNSRRSMWETCNLIDAI